MQNQTLKFPSVESHSQMFPCGQSIFWELDQCTPCSWETTVLLFGNSGGTDASLPFCHCTLQFTWGVWSCVRLWCHWLPHPSHALAAASPALCFYLQNPQVQLSSFIYTYASFIVCASQSLPLQNDLESEEYKNWGYYSMHCPRKFLTVTAFF